jgi:hypothetical protein
LPLRLDVMRLRQAEPASMGTFEMFLCAAAAVAVVLGLTPDFSLRRKLQTGCLSQHELSKSKH